MSEITEIIARLEKAEGADHDIDGAIHVLITGKPLETNCKHCGAFSMRFPRSYTRIVDDALTLVPTNLHWSITSRGVARVGGPAADFMIKGGEHASPAIAICIAALKARVEIESKGAA